MRGVILGTCHIANPAFVNYISAKPQVYLMKTLKLFSFTISHHVNNEANKINIYKAVLKHLCNV